MGRRRIGCLVTGAVAAAAIGAPFNVSVAPTLVTGAGPGPLVTTDQATVTVVPAGAYTYAWEQVSGDALIIVQPTNNATAFRGSPPEAGDLSGFFHCAVTKDGITLYSPLVGAAVFDG